MVLGCLANTMRLFGTNMMMRPDIFSNMMLPDVETKLTRYTLEHACAVYRTKSQDKWKDLVWNNAIITDWDLQLAAEIRSYYAGKFAVSLLQASGSVSNWRKDCYTYCIGQPVSKDFNYGLLLYLPYFYFEDTTKENLRSAYSAGNEMSLADYARYQPGQKISLHLKHKISLPILRKRRDWVEHWFADQSGQPVVWKSYHNEHNFVTINSLVKLWQDRTIEVKSFVDIMRDFGLGQRVLALKLMEVVNVK